MSRKDSILEELRRSRLAISRDVKAVASEFDITSKVKKSVMARPLAWLGSAAAIGYILAGPKSRRVAISKGKAKKGDVPAAPNRSGWAVFFSGLLALFKILLPVLRPALSAYAAQRLGEFAAKSGR